MSIKIHSSNFEKKINQEPKDKITNSNMLLQVNNSIHSFYINIEILKKSSFNIIMHPKRLFPISAEEVLSITARLVNINKKDFNKNLEEIETSNIYQDIYTLAELKNNNKGFEFFDLFEFKKAFINAIKEEKYELLLIKNILILELDALNIFGTKNTCKLIIRSSSDNNIISNNQLKELFDVNNNKKTNNSKITENEKNNTPTTPNTKKCDNKNQNNLLINKKRLRSNEIKNKIIYEDNIPSLPSSEENKSQNESTDSCVTKLYKNIISLPEFQPDTLSKESKILDSYDEEDLIENAISTITKNKKYRLLFRASRDGDKANTFHSLCDKYSNLIILIKTKKGARFGGYTSSKFRSSAHLKFDNNAFLFSLDNKKVFNIIPGEYAIYCYDNTGPCFSKTSLYIPNSFFSKPGKTSKAGGPFQFKKDYELNRGVEKFLVDELEIFQVKLD